MFGWNPTTAVEDGTHERRRTEPVIDITDHYTTLHYKMKPKGSTRRKSKPTKF